jgi:hypothetical protein
MSTRIRRTGFLEVLRRVERQAVGPLRSLHDAEEDRHDLDLRPVAHLQPALPGLAVCLRDVLDQDVGEVGQQVCAQDRAVVAQRGGLALAVDLQPVQVLLAGIGEAHARADHAGQRPGAGLVEHAVQPALSLAPAHAADGPDAALDLAPVGQAVLGVPDLSARAVAQEDEARRLADDEHAR